VSCEAWSCVDNVDFEVRNTQRYGLSRRSDGEGDAEVGFSLCVGRWFEITSSVHPLDSVADDLDEGCSVVACRRNGRCDC